MVDWAIIGGTGLQRLDNLTVLREETLDTPFGAPSAPITIGELGGTSVAFLPRHGTDHTIPPHSINYRANVWALRQIGATSIVAVAAVGGITADMSPSVLIIPDQLIDYTYARAQTFFESGLKSVTHIDFTYPYSLKVRECLFDAAHKANIAVANRGCYGAMQGPRLETAQEIDRLAQDGCTIVGMTGMPEAALARELELEYASFCVVANAAAGRSEGVITMAEIEYNLTHGMAKVRAVLQSLLAP